MLRRNNRLVKRYCPDCDEGHHKKNKKNKKKGKKNKNQDIDKLIASASSSPVTFETLSQQWNKPKPKANNSSILNTRRVPRGGIPVNRPSLRNNNRSTKAQYIVVNKPGCLFCP